MIKRKNLRTKSIRLFILDEADEMLDRGFKEQIYDVYRYLPPGIQVSFVRVFPVQLRSRRPSVFIYEGPRT